MKFFQLALIAGALSLSACAGDSAKKSADTASKRDSLANSERCPPGYLKDEFNHQCVEQQQTRRRGQVRDTLGRSMDTPFPEMSLPTTGGLLGR